MIDIVNEADINHLTGKEKIFDSIHKEYGPPPNWSRPPGFISLSKIILEQQVSLASANAHFLKLNEFISEFTPFEILKLSDGEMRQCHISRQKSSYLRELSIAIVEGNINLESLSTRSESAIRDKLTSIKGIGHWTTDIYLMFCLQAKDIFPIGDIAIINTIRSLSPFQTKEDILVWSQNWKPVRSLATYFLWHHYLSSRIKKSQP